MCPDEAGGLQHPLLLLQPRGPREAQRSQVRQEAGDWGPALAGGRRHPQCYRLM